MAASASAATPVASVPVGAAAPAFRRDDADPGRPVAGLALLAVLLAVVAWAWVRRWRRGPPGARASWSRVLAVGAGAPSLRLVASRRLDGSARVHVLECDGRSFLVGCNGQEAIALLARLDEPSTAGRDA